MLYYVICNNHSLVHNCKIALVTVALYTAISKWLFWIEKKVNFKCDISDEYVWYVNLKNSILGGQYMNLRIIRIVENVHDPPTFKHRLFVSISWMLPTTTFCPTASCNACRTSWWNWENLTSSSDEGVFICDNSTNSWSSFIGRDSASGGASDLNGVTSVKQTISWAAVTGLNYDINDDITNDNNFYLFMFKICFGC